MTTAGQRAQCARQRRTGSPAPVRWCALVAVGLLGIGGAFPAWAAGAMQGGNAAAAPLSCTPKDKVTPAVWEAISGAALGLATGVKSSSVDTVRAQTVAEIASNFAATEALVRGTAANLAGDTLAVTHGYLLDATRRAAGDTAEAEFTCPVADGNEVDFSIAGLPPGRFAFVMVEAQGGAKPWLLSFLLQEQGGGWKMAGFYPHARMVGGHDGLWYWNAARQAVKANRPWLAWAEFTEADALLRPAPFVSTTHLDKLGTELHAATPPELGVTPTVEAPMVVTGADGTQFKVISVGQEPASDGQSLHLVLHLTPATASGPEDRARLKAAADAMIKAHPELREAYSSVLVLADTPGGSPDVVLEPVDQIR